MDNSITKPTGTNAPGIGSELYFAPKEWFRTIPKPTAAEGLEVDRTFNDEAQDPDDRPTDFELLQEALDLLHERMGDGTGSPAEEKMYMYLCLVRRMTPTEEQ